MLGLPARLLCVNAAPRPLRDSGSPLSNPRPAPGTRSGRWLLVAQLAIGIGLIAWLVRQASAADVVAQVAEGPIGYPRLALAATLLVASIGLSFARWRLVAAAAGLPMSLAEATRFGAAGFAANFVALGNIGGDVVKAALLAHRRVGRRTLAVTTVLVDRLMGLFALLLFASGGVLASGLAFDASSTAIEVVARSTLLVTAIACVGFALSIAPGRPLWRLAFLVRRLPLIGRRLGEALLLLDAYQAGRVNMIAALAVGLITDAAFVGSFYCVAKALPIVSPGLSDHLLVVPLGLIAGALPISPNGLGTVEAVIDLLYRGIADSPATHGAIAAGGHRLLMLVVGAAAVVYYFASGEQRRAEQAMSDSPTTTSDAGSGTVEVSPVA